MQARLIIYKMSSGQSKKTTPRQYEVMINFIKNHKSLINSKLSESFTAKDRFIVGQTHRYFKF